MPIDVSGQQHDSCLTMTRLLPSLLSLGFTTLIVALMSSG
jgi:hypothetical protein